jgi:hypothetical protein
MSDNNFGDTVPNADESLAAEFDESPKPVSVEKPVPDGYIAVTTVQPAYPWKEKEELGMSDYSRLHYFKDIRTWEPDIQGLRIKFDTHFILIPWSNIVDMYLEYNSDAYQAKLLEWREVHDHVFSKFPNVKGGYRYVCTGSIDDTEDTEGCGKEEEPDDQLDPENADFQGVPKVKPFPDTPGLYM